MPLIAIAAGALLAAQAATSPSPRTIAWDPASVTLVAEDGFYGRIIPLAGHERLATFSRGDAVWTSRSDDGHVWQPPVRVGRYAFGQATNSELCRLADRRILCTFNERDARDAKTRGSPEPDNGIAVAFSNDDGKSWSTPQRIHGGGPMWEPVAMQRPDGEIRIFFADEKPYASSNEQQISMLASKDNGKTWSGPTNVSFRGGHRDGMPMPATLADGRLVLAIEDNGISPGEHGAFKPVIVDLSRSTTSVAGDDPRRWSALRQPLRASINAGAPYLVRLGTTTTVLSAQVEDGDGRRRMAVWVGDADARNLDGLTYPFEHIAPPKADQSWNALMAVDADHVLAIAGTKIGGKQGIWTIEGRLTD